MDAHDFPRIKRFPRIAVVENEHCTRQAIRGIGRALNAGEPATIHPAG